MEEDQRNVGIYPKKIRSTSTLWICIYLLLMLNGKLASSHDNYQAHNIEEDLRLAVTDEVGSISSSKRTNNAIPEAEESTLDASRKYGVKKSESDLHTQPLEKPYPYVKSQGQIHRDKKSDEPYAYPHDNNIHQSKRSDDIRYLPNNANISIYIIKSQPGSTTEAEFDSQTTSGFEFDLETTTDLTSVTPQQSTEPSTIDDVNTSVTDSTDEFNRETTPEPQEKSTDFAKLTPTVLTTKAQDTTNQPGSMSTSNISSTTTELAPTTFQEESSITFVPDDQTTVTTAVTEPSTTVSTVLPRVKSGPIFNSTMKPIATISISLTASKTPATEPMISTTMSTIPTITTAPVSTTLMTTTTLKPVSTTTVITVKSEITTDKMSTTSEDVVPKMFSSSSETSNSFSTWQDEGSESTTDNISPTLSAQDVNLLIRIEFEGTWYDVCSKMSNLRQCLTDLVNNNIEKIISPRQIIFYQTQCSETLNPSSLVSKIPLTSVLVYIVDENGNFDETLTKILPSLYQMTPIDFPLTIHSFLLVPETDSSNAIAVIIVSCIAFICLILLAGLLFIMRKRQGRFNYGERCRPVSLDAYSLDSVSAYNSVRRSKGALRSSKRSYGNPTFEDSSAIPTHPLNFAGLETFCSDSSAVDEEFVSIPQVSSKIDELPPGAELKNRYANVIPLPETRVPLLRLNNDPLTEYINASYIQGPKNTSKFYIACQAPTDSTVPDFWRMIWEQQCRVIIMLTDLVENGAEKCSEYIPPLEVSDCHRLYGDYQVTLRKREAKEKYAISTLHLKNLEKNTFREVWHIWYLWPANGTPSDGAGLIAVLLEARAFQRNATVPIVVHCSPGTGRTGTLIALDLGIRQYEITRTVDVPRVVYTIRRDRAGAVQTREQYAFIYKGLLLYASKLAGGAIEST